MKILICLKQILDPDIPSRDFRVDPAKKEAERGDANLVPNIFCENALETALQFRDRQDAHITVLSYGDDETEDALRKALAMKADEAVLVIREGASNPDPLSVAQVLAAAARKLGGFDLILLGRESGDWGVGQTGPLMAEELQFPFVSLVDRIEAGTQPGRLLLRRQTDSGHEMVEAAVPVLASVSNSDSNLPRIPKTRDVMKSYRKPLTTWQLGDLEVDAESVRAGNGYYEVVELRVPVKEARCEFAAGDSLEDKVRDFSRKIAGVIGEVS
ncbi:MAG: electron transfer flavoprotein subunit beta/FixA family protein [bacterium]|nr:electron transfer flavoprotein subunit beta/FixA family protein [bacterium]